MVDLSILQSIKQLLGVSGAHVHFDDEILMQINSALMTLNQLGVGPSAGVRLSTGTETWDILLGSRVDLEAVKTYVYLKVRLAFDPPQMSYFVDALKEQAKELEWRLIVQMEGEA